MTAAQQRAYLKTHPNSKLKVSSKREKTTTRTEAVNPRRRRKQKVTHRTSPTGPKIRRSQQQSYE